MKVSKKEKTREWLRITGIATECNDIKMKQKMLDECPILSKRFSSATEKKLFALSSGSFRDRISLVIRDSKLKRLIEFDNLEIIC